MIIRALATKELRLHDWWRVAWREIRTGLALGLLLAVIGFFRVVLWPNAEHLYSEHYVAVAATVALSLIGVVVMGALTGAMLPFALMRFGLDPAAASAPLVATLVDVTGLFIYFSVAAALLRGFGT